MIGQYLEALDKSMDFYSCFFLGDINASTEHAALKDFYNLYFLTAMNCIIF